MSLAHELSRFVLDLRLGGLDAAVVDQAKSLVLDAIACMVAGASSTSADIAMAGLHRPNPGAVATIAVHGLLADASGAAFVNGAMLRSLDLMDVYVSRDVCHPSEIVPAALACTEAGRASGREFLEATIAGLALHQMLADNLALHAHGLHHAGHAAWTVPLVAGRLLTASGTVAARALTITAHRLPMPESFARGQLTNLKAFAYPLLAREGIEAVRLAQAGLAGRESAAEDTVDLLAARFGLDASASDLVPRSLIDLSSITLKIYPAQYALQPLIAAACSAHAAGQGAGRGIEKVVVRASRRTVERTADPAKYAPSGPEAADHSLPFCIAVALMDGQLAPAVLHSGRWAERETLALMERIVAVPIDSTTGYEVGLQEIELKFLDGTAAALSCRYPPPGETPWRIAERKLREASQGLLDADRILSLVSGMEGEADLGRLSAALSSGPHRRSPRDSPR